jgi:aminoglycoside phosphotransferase (APT) family kinase protein
VSNIFAHLNGRDEPSDPVEEGAPHQASEHRRVLARLGEYAALIVGPLNLRPTAAALLAEDHARVEVRISTPGGYVVLVIAPEGDLAAEVCFLRTLAGARLPVPRLIAHDLSCAVVPYTYALESYVGGAPLDRLEPGPLMRVAARQVGRTLRRAHQLAAPGFGRPTVTGRWPARTWAAALGGWLERRELFARAAVALGADGATALRAATLDHGALAWGRPCALHGAVEPARAIVTVGDSAQLEALTRPGDLVGGDPLFDLAHGLLPRHPSAFRQGLLEGYTAAGTLDREQEQRLRRLRLLLEVSDALSRDDPAAHARLTDDVAGALQELGS